MKENLNETGGGKSLQEIRELVKQVQDFYKQSYSKGILLYPNENVVRYLYDAKKRGFESILDFGCGNGRHTEAMARAGFKKIIAVDCNQNLLDITKERLKHYQGELLTHKNEMNDVYDGEILGLVDTAVSWGVLFYSVSSELKICLKNIAKVLKKDGELFANWRTRKDYLYKHGEEVAKDCYLINNTNTHDGIFYHFPSLDELKSIYKEAGFSIVSVESEEFTFDNGTRLNSWWNILAKKD